MFFLNPKRHSAFWLLLASRSTFINTFKIWNNPHTDIYIHPFNSIQTFKYTNSFNIFEDIPSLLSYLHKSPWQQEIWLPPGIPFPGFKMYPTPQNIHFLTSLLISYWYTKADKTDKPFLLIGYKLQSYSFFRWSHCPKHLRGHFFPDVKCCWMLQPPLLATLLFISKTYGLFCISELICNN